MSTKREQFDLGHGASIWVEIDSDGVTVTQDEEGYDIAWVTVPPDMVHEIAAWVAEQAPAPSVSGPSVEVATAPLVAEIERLKARVETLKEELIDQPYAVKI